MRKGSNHQNTKKIKNKEKQQGKKRGTKSFKDKQKIIKWQWQVLPYQ